MLPRNRIGRAARGKISRKGGVALKILVVYYSRTGTTRLVAESVVKAVGADLEEIVDTKNRAGLLGFILSGYQAIFNQLTKIRELKADLSAYDLVVVGSPVWAGKPSTPATSFLKKYQNSIRRLAVFLTHGDDQKSYDSTVKFMERAAGRECMRSLIIWSETVKKRNEYDILRFADELKEL